MRQTLFVALMSAAVAAPGPAQERQPPPVRPAVRLAQLEEEAEVMEAERDVKKAHIKAAEVGVKAAELGAVRLKKALDGGALAVEEFDRAKLEVEAARAQLEIRVAELKAFDVRLKFARKRLEDAKNASQPPNPRPPADKAPN